MKLTVISQQKLFLPYNRTLPSDLAVSFPSQFPCSLSLSLSAFIAPYTAKRSCKFSRFFSSIYPAVMQFSCLSRTIVASRTSATAVYDLSRVTSIKFPRFFLARIHINCVLFSGKLKKESIFLLRMKIFFTDKASPHLGVTFFTVTSRVTLSSSRDGVCVFAPRDYTRVLCHACGVAK